MKRFVITVIVLTVLASAAVLVIKNIPFHSADEVYSTMYSALAGGETYIELNGRYSAEDVSEAIYRLRSDAPELCWLGDFSYSYDSWSVEITARPAKGFKESELSRYCSEVSAKAEAVAREASKQGSDVEKLKYVHDYLVNNCEYDTSSKSSSVNLPSDTAYGCLIDHKALCGGYSKAFQLIVNKLGMKCGVVTGYADEPHGWNYVQLEDDYYWVDVTWDDPVKKEPKNKNKDLGFISEKYFLINDEMLLRSRTISDDNRFVPKCSSLELNPFYSSGRSSDRFSTDWLSDLIAKHYGEGRVNFMFTEKSAYDECISFLSGSGVRSLKAFADKPSSGISISYRHDDRMYTVDLVFDRKAAKAHVPSYPAEV